METGDIILFKSVTCCACCVSCFTRSTVNHVAIVLKDITLDELRLDGIFILQSGIEYVKNVEGKYALGVQIHKLSDLATSYPRAYFRHVKINRDEKFYDKIREFWREIKNAPYDLTIQTWAKLAEVVFFRPVGKGEIEDVKYDKEPPNQNNGVKTEAWVQKLEALNDEIEMRQLLASQTNHQEGFTCSALLAYLFVELGLLDGKQFVNGWKSITPRFFSELKVEWLSEEKRIKL